MFDLDVSLLIIYIMMDAFQTQPILLGSHGYFSFDQRNHTVVGQFPDRTVERFYGDPTFFVEFLTGLPDDDRARGTGFHLHGSRLLEDIIQKDEMGWIEQPGTPVIRGAV